MKFFWNSDEKGKSDEKKEFEEKDEVGKTGNSEEEMKQENEPEEVEKIENDKVDKPVGREIEGEEYGEEAEQEETDKNDNSKNDENKLEKILENIEDINGKVEILNNLFLKKIQSIEFEKKTTDKLYKELQEYKNDMYFQLIKPIVMSLVSIRESMKKNLKNTPKLY